MPTRSLQRDQRSHEERALDVGALVPVAAEVSVGLPLGQGVGSSGQLPVAVESAGSARHAERVHRSACWCPRPVGSDTTCRKGLHGLYVLPRARDRKSTRLNSSHVKISYAVFCLKKKIYKTTGILTY